jgi:putative ABC transport system substrate-binding protein
VRRREFITLLGGVAAAAPFSARAQQADGMRRIGVLIPFAESDTDAQAQVRAFQEAFQKLGWQEGRNIRIDYRWTGGDVDRIRTFAKEIVELHPDVILGRSTPVIAALLKESRTVPIVFVVVSDPVGEGFIATMAKPGGNVTGFTNVESSLGGKWLALLKEIVPGISHISVMLNPKTAPGGGSYYLRMVESAAAAIGVQLIVSPIQDAAEIERTINEVSRDPNGGLVVMPDVTTVAHRKLIVSLAAEHRVPAVYGFRSFAKDGGLVSYGVDLIDLYRRGATYVDRILRGVKPSDLPVQAPTGFEMIINLKSAKALGLTVPPTLLATADEVIE